MRSTVHLEFNGTGGQLVQTTEDTFLRFVREYAQHSQHNRAALRAVLRMDPAEETNPVDPRVPEQVAQLYALVSGYHARVSVRSGMAAMSRAAAWIQVLQDMRTLWPALDPEET